MTPLLISSCLQITAAGVGVDAFAGAGGLIQKREEWVAVGGSWRDEENVCGYWRFSDGAAAVSALTEASDSNEVLPAGKQVNHVATLDPAYG